MKYLCINLLLCFLLFCGCNPCKDVVCLNGGICHDGTCECPDAYQGPDCNDHKIPIYLTFLKVQVTDIPSLKSNGDTWDEDGSAADIVVVLSGTNSNGDWLYHASDTQENVTTSNSADLGRPLTIVNNYFYNLHTVGVYDKDEGTGEESLELICSYDWNVLSLAESTEYSTELVFSKSDCPGIQLEVEYGYSN